MKLKVLADRDVGQIAGMILGDLTNGAKLARGENAVGDADADHEVFGSLALVALAADRSDPSSLGVDAPPLEVGGGPFRRHARASFARESPHFVERLPGILLPLQPFRSLRLGFLYRSLF